MNNIGLYSCLGLIILLIINRLTIQLRIDYVGFKNENPTDFTDFKFILYYWSFKRKKRISITL